MRLEVDAILAIDGCLRRVTGIHYCDLGRILGYLLSDGPSNSITDCATQGQIEAHAAYLGQAKR
jgi:hypothetical protein